MKIIIVWVSSMKCIWCYFPKISYDINYHDLLWLFFWLCLEWILASKDDPKLQKKKNVSSCFSSDLIFNFSIKLITISTVVQYVLLWRWHYCAYFNLHHLVKEYIFKSFFNISYAMVPSCSSFFSWSNSITMI